MTSIRRRRCCLPRPASLQAQPHSAVQSVVLASGAAPGRIRYRGAETQQGRALAPATKKVGNRKEGVSASQCRRGWRLERRFASIRGKPGFPSGSISTEIAPVNLNKEAVHHLGRVGISRAQVVQEQSGGSVMRVHGRGSRHVPQLPGKLTDVQQAAGETGKGSLPTVLSSPK